MPGYVIKNLVSRKKITKKILKLKCVKRTNYKLLGFTPV